MSRAALLALALAGACTAHAQSSCSSDRVPQPGALLERFINADCDSCWADPATPRARRGELALDWIAPGGKGEDAPLAVAASGDALARLQALGRARPLPTDLVRHARQGRSAALRVAHGLPFNDYMGASIELKDAAGGPWTAWLALVETLPAGTEGSPVERNLVRNLLQLSWPAGPGPRVERRPMRIPEGAHADRLRVVGWVEDARGVIRAISESVCGPPAGQR
jgi:hypothetical protein